MADEIATAAEAGRRGVEPDVTTMFMALSRDIEVLRQARSALLAHPEGSLTAPSFSRILISISLNTLEVAFKALGDSNRVASAYIQPKTSNDERADNVCNALEELAIDHDPEIVKRVFFLKRLRNTYTHGEWRSNDFDTARRLGFNTDFDHFNLYSKDDWGLVEDALRRFIGYVQQSRSEEFLDLLLRPDLNHDSFHDASDGLQQMSGYASDDISTRFWFDGDEPRRNAWRLLEALCDLEHQASLPADIHEVVRFAAAAWEVVDGSLHSVEDIEASIEVLTDLLNRKILPSAPVGISLGSLSGVDTDLRPKWAPFLDALKNSDPGDLPVWSPNVEDPVGAAFLRCVVPGADPVVLLKALRVGYKSRDNAPNISAALLLSALAANPEYEASDRLTNAAQSADRVAHLNELWYQWVKSVEPD